MTRRSRRNHSAAFKAKVALAALKGDRTMSELSQQCDRHPNQIKQWKDQLLENVQGVFESTIKYGEVYLHAYATVSEARASIGRYLAFYNGRRPHSSLGGRTPDQAYLNPQQPIPAAA